jgi:energy-coupling factor transport system substrate-specific component
MSLAEQLKKDFSTVTLTLIPVAIVLNMVIGQLASAVKLPVFLDSIGTILVGILAGPWAGLLTGVMTNLIWGLISSPVAAAFAPVAGVIGLVAGLCARAGLFNAWWKAIIAGALIGIAASFTAVPIRVYMFGGITGSGADFITAYLLKTGSDLFGAVIITVMSANVPDKIASALLAWGIVRALPERFRFRFPRAERIAIASR